jgi:hypothetical protein
MAELMVPTLPLIWLTTLTSAFPSTDDRGCARMPASLRRSSVTGRSG